MRLHLEALTAAQLRALRRLGPLLEERSFYLAGGTALALQLGHRRSADLDWFTGQTVRDPLLLARNLQAAGLPLVVAGSERGTLHGTVSGIRVTLLEYRYPLLSPLIAGLFSAPLASLGDLAAMKLAAVAQRGSRKDFVDLYALGRRIPLARMLRLYQRKYGVRDIGHVLFALTYFDDADVERMPRMLLEFSWPAIKDVIRAWVLALSR